VRMTRLASGSPCRASSTMPAAVSSWGRRSEGSRWRASRGNPVPLERASQDPTFP
jgi:hypothetical protein